MPLTTNALPSTPVSFAAPFDAQFAFLSTPTAFTATGFLPGSPVTLDLGGANPSSSAGRTDGLWALNISAMDFVNGDETYRLSLCGSNDAAFANGNVDLLAFQDFAAASAGRIVPTVMGASLAAPTTCFLPFVNTKQKLIYRFVRLHLTVGGTTPSITLMSWLSFDGVAI